MQPMFCVPLKGGLRIVTLIDLIVSSILLVVSILALFYYETRRDDAISYLKNPPGWIDWFMNMREVKPNNMRALLGFCIAYYAQKAVLAFLLLVATVKESKLLIRIFVLHTLALLCIHVLIYLTLLCFSMMEAWSIIIYTAAFMFQEWHMWTSSKYLDELVAGTTGDEDDFYDFGSRRSSGNDAKYSYKL